jgi:hypothetical protein
MDGWKGPRWCPLALVVLSLLYFGQIWTHPTEIIHTKHSDIVSQHYPWRMFAVTSWREHRALPLWTPYCYSGQPFQADAQTTLFYPPHWLFYCVPATGVAPLFGVLIWAHVLAAGLAMYAYARHRGLQPLGALVAGIGFMFAGKWLLHVLEAGHYVFVPLAWFPLLVLVLEKGVAGRWLRYGAAAGIVTALLLTGAQPQLTLYAGLVAGLVTLVHALVAPLPARQSSSRLAALGCWCCTWLTAAIVALGLAAVHVLPTMELAGMTSRAHSVTPEYGAFYDLTIRNSRELVQRLLALVGPQNFSGNPWENVGAFGVLWTGTGLLALVLCRRREVWIQGCLLLLLVLFALGPGTPFYPGLCRIVPLLSMFRIPARMLMFAGFPLGVLAGFATDRFFAGRAMPRTQLSLAAGFLTAVVYLYFVASVDTSPPDYRYWWWIVTIGPALGLCLIGCARLSSHWASRMALVQMLAALAWVGFLTADLWGLHRYLVRTRPLEEVYPVNDAIAYLAAHPDGRVADRSVNDGQPTFSPLTNGLCNLHGIEWVRGLNVTDLYRYKQFLNYIADKETPPALNEIPVLGPIVNQPLLDLLAVRYLIAPTKMQLTPREQVHWRLAQKLANNRVHQEADSRRGGMHDLPPFIVYERTQPLPRAFVVGEARPMPETNRLAVLRTTDFRRTVLLESGPAMPAAPSEGAGASFQEAEITERAPNRLVVEVDRQAPGYLVLLESWYPGWRCRLEDGQELPIWRANHLFRSVAVPAGRHRLEFRFEPSTYFVGRAVSAGTCLLLVVLGIASRVRRNTQSECAGNLVVSERWREERATMFAQVKGAAGPDLTPRSP